MCGEDWADDSMFRHVLVRFRVEGSYQSKQSSPFRCIVTLFVSSTIVLAVVSTITAAPRQCAAAVSFDWCFGCLGAELLCDGQRFKCVSQHQPHQADTRQHTHSHEVPEATRARMPARKRIRSASAQVPACRPKCPLQPKWPQAVRWRPGGPRR